MTTSDRQLRTLARCDAANAERAKAQPPATATRGELSRLLKPSKYEGSDHDQATYSKGAYDQWLDDRIHLDALEQERDQARAEASYYKQAHTNDTQQLGATIDRQGKELDQARAQVADLLAALRDLADVSERIGPPPIQQGTLCEEQDYATAMRKAQAAIARAEGKEQS
jgi:hypothetical protein